MYYISQDYCIQIKILQWNYSLITESQASLPIVEDYTSQKAKIPNRQVEWTSLLAQRNSFS